MMKIQLVILSMLTFTSQLFAAEEIKAPAVTTVYGGASIKEGTTLSKLMANPPIAAQYASCKKALVDKLEEIPKCLWEGYNGNPPALPANLKDEVKKIYAEEETAAPKSEATPTTNFTGRSDNIQTSYSSDPAVQALSTFFGKKLDEVLNGSAQDKKDKKIMIIEHSTFINLYTSELGKSIVNAFTSYCLDTKSDCRDGNKDKLCLIPKNENDRKDAKDANLATINKADLSAKEGEAWTYCIGTVSGVCYEKDDPSKPDLTYSKQRACLVMDFVKSARKNLIVAGEQKKFYEELGKVGGNIEDKRLKQIDENDLKGDKLSQITSSDVVSDVKKANDQSVKEATDCETDINKAKCDKFLDTNKTKSDDAIAEFGLRQFAKADDLDDKLKDKTNVSSYLKEEGYTDEQITNLIKPENIDEIKRKIKERFANEKDAIIKEMAGRVKAKTSEADGSINKADSTKLGAIKADLQSRNDDLKNLVHFNNIVASYLDVTNGTNTTRNTASLFAEVNSMDKKDSQVLLDNIKKNKDIVEHQDTADLKIEDINDILKYH